jgi:caffeoyl-CoA O-methyltransferase
MAEPMPDKFTQMTPELYRYMVHVGTRRDDVLVRLAEETEALGGIAVMMMSPEQGAFTTLLAKVTGARRALEVGTFTGYGSISIARGLAEGGLLVTCEIEESYSEIARGFIAEAGLDDRIDIRMGPALETMQTLPADEPFDLVFIDADKTGYGDYYEEALRLTRLGGLILIDNVFRGGDVVDPENSDDATLAIRALNEKISGDERVEIAMVPISDGLTLARKL